MIYERIVAILKENNDPDEAAEEIIEMLQGEGILNSDEDEEEYYEPEMEGVHFV